MYGMETDDDDDDDDYDDDDDDLFPSSMETLPVLWLLVLRLVSVVDMLPLAGPQDILSHGPPLSWCSFLPPLVFVFAAPLPFFSAEWPLLDV